MNRLKLGREVEGWSLHQLVGRSFRPHFLFLIFFNVSSWLTFLPNLHYFICSMSVGLRESLSKLGLET